MTADSGAADKGRRLLVAASLASMMTPAVMNVWSMLTSLQSTWSCASGINMTRAVNAMLHMLSELLILQAHVAVNTPAVHYRVRSELSTRKLLQNCCCAGKIRQL